MSISARLESYLRSFLQFLSNLSLLKSPLQSTSALWFTQYDGEKMWEKGVPGQTGPREGRGGTAARPRRPQGRPRPPYLLQVVGELIV